MSSKEKELLSAIYNVQFGDGFETVRALLADGDVDVNTREDNWLTARSPLDHASIEGNLRLVELLLKANADPNAANQRGETALNYAAYYGHSKVVAMLLKANADPRSTDESGKTTLHWACQFHQSDVARTLLNSGAHIHAKAKDGHEPLHCCVYKRQNSVEFVSTKTLKTLQVLVAFGASWDVTCDEFVAEGKAFEEAPALRICMALWVQEVADGGDLTEISLEVVKRGAPHTQAYIDDLKTSRKIVLRRKICVVGPSCAGKMSLVKSITSKHSQLEHHDGRTIGIDHFPYRFLQLSSSSDLIKPDKGNHWDYFPLRLFKSNSGSDKHKIHEVTFWDFAGQDAYQVAHSLFFSPRTMYLVCIDLEAFTVAYMEAVIIADEETQETKLLDEFMEHAVMRWICMIVARQPDAEFVFIETKKDVLLTENQATRRFLKNHLKAKVGEVECKMRWMKSKHTGDAENTPSVARSRAAASRNQPTVVFVSCASPASVLAARSKINDLVVKSDNSFQMPDTYSQVLDKILRIREEARRQSLSTRITQVFTPVDTLPAKLQIEPTLCRQILQTLHDLGDVLWYDDLGVKLFKNTLILDPLLVIDFIRLIFDHKNTGQIISHTDLKALPHWAALRGDKQMEAMKQVLQAFNLVYSDDENGVMNWNSDLIVPASWQTKPPAVWKFLGDRVQINSTRTRVIESIRVHWEYQFDYGLPLPLFDQLVVASHRATILRFDAGPDWIAYEEKEVAACRIMVSRDRKSRDRTIHVEAVVAAAATPDQLDELWRSFRQLCGAFVKGLRQNPGLLVSRFAWMDNQTKIGFNRLLQSDTSSENWMPPAETWEWFKRLEAGSS